MKAIVALLITLLLLAGCVHEPVFRRYATIDFTTKRDGDPPAELDTGQPVDFLQSGAGRKPQIVGGELVHSTLPSPEDAGNFANYYQAKLDGDARSFGARWTVDGSDGSSTAGIAVIAAWADVFQASVTQVPKSPGHITFNTVTGAWAWWVGDGGPEPGRPSNLRSVKSGRFTLPASDGKAVWEAAVSLDPDNGVGYLFLPGNDATTGTRLVTLTDAEIATALTAVGLPAMTIRELSDGSDVVMVQHFAKGGVTDTARYPRFLSMWSESVR
jgi:hypothetical protein